MKNLIITVLLAAVLTSCVTQSSYDKLLAENEALKMQVDELINGAEKLYAKIKKANTDKDYESVKSIFAEIEKRHIDTDYYAPSKVIYDKVVAIEAALAKAEKQRLAKEKAEKMKALTKLKKKFDDVSGNTWYYNPYYTHYNNTTGTSVYFGSKDKRKWLRLEMSYCGSDWYFFEKAYLSYDGNTLQIPFNKYENKKTDHSGGQVWEWIDVTVTDDIKAFLEKLVDAKTAKMRLTGKYTKTKTLSWTEKKAIKDVILGYDVLE